MNSNTIHKPKEVTYVDLFCGLGAFHTAFNKNSNDRIKYRCVFACDIDKHVRNIYNENYHIQPHGDIHTLNISEMPDFDILCAGFPCQPFSIAGKKEGFNNKMKGNLFYKILNIVDIKQPTTIILENVKNLLTIHNGHTFQIIKNQLELRGYKISYKVIDSRYYQSPQSRKRIYIVCNKHTMYTFKDIHHDIVPVSSILDPSVVSYLDYEEKYRLEKCSGTTGMMIYKLFNKITGKGGRQGFGACGRAHLGTGLGGSHRPNQD